MFGEKKIKGTAFVPSGKSAEIKAKTKTEARTLVSLLIRAASRTLVDRGISVRGCEHAPHGQVVAAPAQSGANRAHGYLPGPACRGSPTTDGGGGFRSPSAVGRRAPAAAAPHPSPVRPRKESNRSRVGACPVLALPAAIRPPVTRPAAAESRAPFTRQTAPPFSPPGHAFTVAFNLFPFVIFYCGFVCVHKGTRAGDPCWKR